MTLSIFSRIIKDKNYFDIGMHVVSSQRRQGLGTQIILDLVRYCQDREYIPVCGCDINNAASRKTLEKAGFISKHILIEFKN